MNKTKDVTTESSSSYLRFQYKIVFRINMLILASKLTLKIENGQFLPALNYRTDANDNHTICINRTHLITTYFGVKKLNFNLLTVKNFL